MCVATSVRSQLQEPVFDVRELNRVVAIVVIVLNGMATGVFGGFAGLALAMRRERQFCSSVLQVDQCDAFNYTLVFNLGFIGQAIVGPLWGFVLDRVGPRFVSFFGAVTSSLGILLIAFSDTSPSPSPDSSAMFRGFNGWGAGFFFLGASCVAIQAPLFQLSNLFVRRAQVSSLAASMFILSTLVLPIVNSIHLALSATVSLRTLLLALLILPGIVLMNTVLFLPRQTIPATFVADRAREAAEKDASLRRTVVRESVLEVRPDGGRRIKRLVRIRRARGRATATKSVQLSRALPLPKLVALGGFWQQVLSLEAITGFLYFGVNIVPFNWYIASNKEQLQALGDDGTLVTAFQFFVPAGVVATPFIGYLLDRFGLFPASVVVATNVILIGVFTLIPSLRLQWATFVLLAVGRPLHMAVFFAFFIRFGFANFGKLTSFGLVGFGVFNQLQFAYLALVDNSDSARKNFSNSNALVLVLSIVVGVLLCTVTYFRLHRQT